MDVKILKQRCTELKVLYVEDNEDAKIATLKLLNFFFHNIITAEDGQDGLDKFKNQEFDLIISDIIMPRLNGIEMLEEIRKFNSDVPILYFSAFNETNNFIKAIELGTDAFIIKPIKQDQFISAISRVVDRLDFKRADKRYKDALELEVKERTKELEYKLYYDELTGLLNRVAFFEKLTQITMPVVFLIDIDKFKIINKVYSDRVGSIVLSKFAQFLSAFAEEESFLVYRLSGDEFVILDTTSDLDLDKYEIFVTKLFKELRHFKIHIDGFIISIDVTIGLSAVEKESFEKANMALEYAKDHKKQYVMYSESIDTSQRENQLLVYRDKILAAIHEKRVIPVFQPIVDSSENIVKYEALMRIQINDFKEFLYPGEFLDTAIKTRLYEELSSMTIFTVLDRMENSKSDISINFTYSDIENKPFIHDLEVFFSHSPHLGKRAVFEITESESIKNYDSVKSFIKRFRKFGVRIAIDDFGSGFSNFEYILEILPDYLKIDGSLIKVIDTDSRSYTLVQAIVEFSHRLGIKVIAEYVYSKVIFDMLKDLNVDEYQGFYFSEPLLELDENYKKKI